VPNLYRKAGGSSITTAAINLGLHSPFSYLGPILSTVMEVVARSSSVILHVEPNLLERNNISLGPTSVLMCDFMLNCSNTSLDAIVKECFRCDYHLKWQILSKADCPTLQTQELYEPMF
jgi:hypothetical protein